MFVLLAACPRANPAERNDAGDRADAGSSEQEAGESDAGEADAGVLPEDASAPDAESVRTRACSTTVTYRDRPGLDVFIAGSWNLFRPDHDRMIDQRGDGTYVATLALAPGLYPYKLVVGGDWILDPSHKYRAYDNNVENSGLRVDDCHAPLLEVGSVELHTSGTARGSARFTIHYTEANGGTGPDFDRFDVRLRSGTSSRALTASELSWNAATWELGVALTGLADGKHTVAITAKNNAHVASNKLVLPFWVEPEAFDWKDAIIYLVVTDRFRDGNAANTPPPTADAVPSGDFKGGDLEGVTLAIREGYFDQLGIRALWLTPFNTQPSTAYPNDSVHHTMGYHGYWPTEPRKVDPRFGGDQALFALTEAAHEHGIRVLMDFAINQLHENHPYVREHPDWVKQIGQGGCLCGSPGCDWTERRLDCLFAPFLPDVTWQNNDAAAQMVSDGVWWVDRFDLDGLRVDAVKHVPDVAVFNLATQIEEHFETAGTKYYLVGETAMGWYDCDPFADPNCNAENYGTIGHYVGPHALKGQFDFVLHHSTALRVFAYDEHGMIHADVWTHASETHYPEGALMATYIGSHDESRFVTHVFEPDVVGHKWPDEQLATPPTNELPYKRLGLAETWNLTAPYTPMLYYGDEYGEFGASDPDNRHVARFDPDRNDWERALFETMKSIGTARRELIALRRGRFITLATEENFWAYARAIPATSDIAIVAINRDASPITRTVALGNDVSLAAGLILRDRLHGITTTVSQSNSIEIMLPAYSSAIFAP